MVDSNSQKIFRYRESVNVWGSRHSGVLVVSLAAFRSSKVGAAEGRGLYRLVDGF